MRAHKLTALYGVAIVCLALLSGCGGGGSDSSSSSNPPPDSNSVTAAESILGVGLLPPDGVTTAAAALTKDELAPGDANGTTTLSTEELPPS